MPDEPLTNAAVERLRSGHAFLNALFAPDGQWPSPAELKNTIESMRPLYTDDFVYEDRRRLVGFGRVDITEWLRVLESVFDSGNQQPRWSILEVIAVRGERTAANLNRLEYASGALVESIVICHLDEDLQRTHRLLTLDVEDREGAMAEVERLHAEGGE